MTPSSFCTICTHTCYKELIGLLLSLSLHHPNAIMYCMVDSKTKEEIDKLTPKPKLDIRWKVSLDKYTGLNRAMMTQKKIFGTFLINKINIIKEALKENKDTLFLDSDIFILDKITDIDHSKELGLSPHYIKDTDVKNYGFYNAGVFWVNNIKILDAWTNLIDNTHSCPEQINMVKLKQFDYFEFGENYNFSWWRVKQSSVSPQEIVSNISIKEKTILYKNKPLKFVHTHFNNNDSMYRHFNVLIVNLLQKCKRYRELLCLTRMIENKWTIILPHQPMTSHWFHANDSFRELCILLRSKNADVDIELMKNKGNVWLKPNILLYDRPTLQWINQLCLKSYKMLLGNGKMEKEGKELREKGVDVSPWIFWPRRPMILEKILGEKGRLVCNQRSNESIFIGNYENIVQEKYRNTSIPWDTVISFFKCTSGKKHTFSQSDYLMKMRESKYGLCLRGFGSKCHREVECMAFGTVPLITDEVSIDSYYDPPIENKHYLRVSSPEEAKEKMDKTTEEEWTKMSLACYEWYQRNVHSDQCWDTMINYLLYNQ